VLELLRTGGQLALKNGIVTKADLRKNETSRVVNISIRGTSQISYRLTGQRAVFELDTTETAQQEEDPVRSLDPY